MKNTLKAFIASATLAAFAAPALAAPVSADPSSYAINSVDGSVKISVVVQGAGAAKIPSPGLSFPGNAVIKQSLMLNNDKTFTGGIYVDTDGNGSIDATLFSLTGIWYRPEGSKTIYYAIDGDPTKGADSDGTYGGLFDSSKAAAMSLQDFMPLLFPTKISAIEPIYPTVGLKTGVIKLKLDKFGGIVSATTDMNVAGRAMVSYCKGDKSADDGDPETPLPCTIDKGTKDASFSFSVKSKATVEPDPT